MANQKTQQTQALAYEYWQRDGSPHGRDMEHWLEAERALKNGSTKAPKAASKPAIAKAGAPKATAAAPAKATPAAAAKPAVAKTAAAAPSTAKAKPATAKQK